MSDSGRPIGEEKSGSLEEFWKKQAAQYKQELDEINPKFNQSQAALSTAVNDYKELKQNYDSLSAQSAVLKNQYQELVGVLNSTKTELDSVLNEAKQLVAKYQALEQEHARVKQLLTVKNRALIPCLKGIGDVLAHVRTAIEAGE